MQFNEIAPGSTIEFELETGKVVSVMKDDDTLDEKLRRAWHSDSTLAQVAKKLGLGISDVKSAWQRLRLEGKLPARGRRQPAETLSDGRPSVNMLGDDPLANAFSKGKR